MKAAIMGVRTDGGVQGADTGSGGGSVRVVGMSLKPVRERVCLYTLVMKLDPERVLTCARDTLAVEADAVRHLSGHLNGDFVEAVAIVLACKGRVVVTGMGKSGHVGRKIAATLASTGTPSMFVHPAEASHGDLGMITGQDVVIALSNSGESDELTTILPLIKRLGAKLIGITGHADSTLARFSDVVLDSSVEREACPLNLAPTASTTAQLALGDALAMALLDARGFKAEDFALSHPGGTLGRKLLTHVHDVMRSLDETPRVTPQATFSEVMLQMTKGGLGMTAVVDESNHVKGIFTDGDLRRLLEKLTPGTDLHQLHAADVMTADPRTVRDDALAVQAAEVMEKHAITQVLVVDAAGGLVGALNTHDLMRAKVI